MRAPPGRFFVGAMKLIVNGNAHEHWGDGAPQALLAELGVAAERVALVVNERVVPRREWEDLRLKPGDRVEMLTFMGGG